MDQPSLLWIGIVGGALVTGVTLVGFLVLKRGAQPLMVVVGVASGAVTVLSFGRLSAYYQRFDAMLYAFAFVVAAAVGGYALASTLLGRFAARPAAITLDPDPALERDVPAVVLAACIEPPAYDPAATAAMVDALAADGLIEPSIGALPFIFFSQKARYGAAGGASPAHGELVSLTEMLEGALGEARVTWATCTGPDAVERRVTELANEGFRRIVVAELSVAEPTPLVASKREIDALRPGGVGVSVRYTGGLWSSERLAAMVTERVAACVERAEETGVVLVGHGQPEEHARANAQFDEHENAFLNRIRMQLAERGLDEGRVRVAWGEWSNPDVTSVVRHLGAIGCRRVIVSPACFPLDTLSTRLDLEISVRQARVDEGVAVVTLSAWRDGPELVNELTERVRRALEPQAD